MYLPQTVFVVVDEGPKGETRLADPADVFGPEEGDCAIQTCMMHKDDVSHRGQPPHWTYICAGRALWATAQSGSA